MGFVTGNHDLIRHPNGWFYAPTAIIKDDVKIGKDSKIWHYTNLYGCEIGEDTQIATYCEIRRQVKIGDHCRFQPYVIVGEHADIGNYVFVASHVIFSNERWPSAVKSIEGCGKLEATIVRDHAIIGSNVKILPSISIGEFAFIGSGSRVHKDVKPYQIVVGNPAVRIGDIREKKYQERFPELQKFITDWGEYKNLGEK